MSNKSMTATAFRKQFKQALEFATLGNRIVITRHGKTVAAVITAGDLAKLEPALTTEQVAEAFEPAPNDTIVSVTPVVA